MHRVRTQLTEATASAIGAQEARERQSKEQQKENAEHLKRERPQTQRDVWVQVSTEPHQWVGTLAAAGIPSTMPRLDITRDVRPLSPEIKQGIQSDDEVAEGEDNPWSPACTHMSESGNEQRFLSPPGGGIWRKGWMAT